MLFSMSSLPFVVRGSADGVEGWSLQRLPFEPKGWMVAYRTALREALGRLDSARGPVLVASFTSTDRRPCDVENSLLYNLGLSAFAHLRCEEVVLARSFLPPVPPPDGDAGALVYHHRYQLAAEAPPADPGQVVARFPAIALRRPVTVEKLWYDLRTSGELVANQSSRARRLGLDLTLRRPPRAVSPSMLGLVKVLVDGVVSALHVHDGSHVQVISERLASRLGACTTELANMLQANSSGVLGERRLLWPFRDYVQWNPADDAIVELRIGMSASDTWRISGDLRDLDA